MSHGTSNFIELHHYVSKRPFSIAKHKIILFGGGYGPNKGGWVQFAPGEEYALCTDETYAQIYALLHS